MALYDSAVSRRKFLNSASALALGATVAPIPSLADDTPAFASLKPLGNRVHPITAEEFQGRARHAQESMGQLDPKFDAIILGPGTSLYYFTGIRWWLSERLLCLVLPRSGQPILISPAFEESRMRESLRYPVEVRLWEEDESPTQLIATSFADRNISTGRIGIEEALPFTFYDHLRAAASGCTFVSADPVTIGCRSIKSEHELALMRLACEATFDVFREVFASLKEGMSQDDIGNLINAGFAKMELRGEALVLLGASAAQPHGSKIPKKLKEGDVVLIDGGCAVQGYQSDVSRTGVFGKPSARVQQVYEIVRKTQNAALDAARAGKLSGTTDDAARAVITGSGYGPDYKYLVRGSKTVLMPGMTFSNEPGIYIPGEFGLRCEDDMVIVADGPAKLLTQGFQVSLEKPLG
jgi:Xaa-Pro dipeptidase